VKTDWHFAFGDSSPAGHPGGIFFGVNSAGRVSLSADLSVNYGTQANAPIMAIAGRDDPEEFCLIEGIRRLTESGTLYVSYDPALDRVYLSVNGYWRGPAPSAGDWVVDGLIRGTWGLTDVAVHLGVWTASGAFDGSTTWFDNFEVTQGVLVTPPMHILTVTSTPNAGVAIEVRPDETGAPTATASTPFTRTYGTGIPVFLFAPATDGKGNCFRGWELDGTPWLTGRTIELVVAAGHEFRAVYGARGFVLALAPGWNAVSIPFATTTTFAHIFSAGQRGNIMRGSVWRWDATAQQYVPVADTATPEAQVGYWVNSPNGGWTPPVTGTPASGTVNLAAGWNLVGPAADCALPNSPHLLLPAWRWHAAEKRYEAVSGADRLTPGQAYWLYATGATPITLGGE
jgi:hypothetical protein